MIKTSSIIMDTILASSCLCKFSRIGRHVTPKCISLVLQITRTLSYCVKNMVLGDVWQCRCDNSSISSHSLHQYHWWNSSLSPSKRRNTLQYVLGKKHVISGWWIMSGWFLYLLALINEFMNLPHCNVHLNHSVCVADCHLKE